MMSLKFLCCTLVLFATVILVETRSYNTGLIFYDPDTKQIFLPPTVSVSRGRALAHFKYSAKGSIWSTFGKPCDCSGPLCGCCVGIKVKQYNFDQKMCANVSYVRSKDEVNFEVYLNEVQSGKYGISARNPSPFCIPIMMPIPMSMCVQMSNVGLQGNNLNMCMDLIMLLDSTQLFEMHFQCMKMGAEGVQWVGPGGSPVIPPGESKIKTGSNEDSKEYYDEVEDMEEQELEQNEEEHNNIEEQEANEEDKEEVDLNKQNKDDSVDEEDNEISPLEVENLQDVEEVENNAKEVLDNDHKDNNVAIDEPASDCEETKENEVNSSDEERMKIVNNEVPKEEIVQLPKNSTIVKYPIISISSTNMQSENEKEIFYPENKNESDSGQLIIAALDDMVQKELNETAITDNSKPLLATKPITSLALDNNCSENVDNAATIATITSSTIALTTEATDVAAAIVPEALPLLLTPEATATVAVASSVNDEESNNNDNSEDNDSDYEDEESDEDDAKEEVESNEVEEEDKTAATEIEGFKETLESNGDNVTANDRNEIESEEKGHDSNNEDVDDNNDDNEDDNEDDKDDDEDETEEDSDEITTVSTVEVNITQYNTSFSDKTDANAPDTSLTSSSTNRAIIKETLVDSKLKENVKNITNPHFQLTTETMTNISVDSDNLDTKTNVNSDIKPSIMKNNNNLTSNFTTPLVANDSTLVKSSTDAGGSKDQLQLSQITATVTPQTSARNLLAIQRQKLQHQVQRQRQHKQQQQQQQQQYKKWQYAPHQQYQVQHQKHHRHLNHNHLQYQINAARQHRRVFYEA